MKLCYEYPNLTYDFNWLIRARSGYKLDAKITYVKDLKYPKEATITLIHENNKLVIVEID